jgi:3-dehydroquinate synthase
MLPNHISVTQQPSDILHAFLVSKNYSQIFVVTDENTHSACYPLLEKGLPSHTVITIPSGEASKTLSTCQQIWQQLTDKKADRHAAVVVLGGGVLGDMAGFCAATYKRGIDFILIPTTLLAQADASIGGKLGIDFNHFKNHIGVFQQPALTILFSGFLKTLPERELLSGFAEVIKHALISDAGLWNEIRRKKLKEQDWDKLLRHSAEFKYSIVEQDPTEKGLRKILNAGHTIGHALEAFFLEANRSVTHGEAVAAGLIAEAFIAHERGLIHVTYLSDINTYLKQTFGRLDFSGEEMDAVAEKALQDKKNKGKEIFCVLLEGEGRAGWDYSISLQDVKRALTFYLS